MWSFLYNLLHPFIAFILVLQISSMAIADTCLDADVHESQEGQPVRVSKCYLSGLTQHFALTKEGQIRRDNGCIELSKTNQLITMSCKNAETNAWMYKQDFTIMRRGRDGKELCMTFKPRTSTFWGQPCTPGSNYQLWHWQRKRDV